MVTNDDIKKAVDLINNSDNFLITAHTKADGDACGCMLTLADV